MRGCMPREPDVGVFMCWLGMKGEDMTGKGAAEMCEMGTVDAGRLGEEEDAGLETSGRVLPAMVQASGWKEEGT